MGLCWFSIAHHCKSNDLENAELVHAKRRNTCSSQITVFITVISSVGQVGQLGSYPWTLESLFHTLRSLDNRRLGVNSELMKNNFWHWSIINIHSRKSITKCISVTRWNARSTCSSHIKRSIQTNVINRIVDTLQRWGYSRVFSYMEWKQGGCIASQPAESHKTPYGESVNPCISRRSWKQKR